MTENQKVLKYLQSGHPLTCFQAIKMGISHNLRSRISNLKDQGHEIQKQFIEVKKSNGKVARVMEYWI